MAISYSLKSADRRAISIRATKVTILGENAALSAVSAAESRQKDIAAIRIQGKTRARPLHNPLGNVCFYANSTKRQRHPPPLPKKCIYLPRIPRNESDDNRAVVLLKMRGICAEHKGLTRYNHFAYLPSAFLLFRYVCAYIHTYVRSMCRYKHALYSTIHLGILPT